MKAINTSSDAGFAPALMRHVSPDLPAEAPLAMPVQSFGARPGRYTSPRTSPFNIGNRRLMLFTAVAALTSVLLTELVLVCMPGGIDWVEAALLALFMPLFAWIALSFCSAVAGFSALMRGRVDGALIRDEPVMPTHRTAVLLPIYNEDVDAVFRRLKAMVHSLKDTGAASAFDVFILSDTTDSGIEEQERRAFEGMRAGSPLRVYYRHRPRNIDKKPGNIAEWVRRFGASYAYMIVLDADSVMSGKAMLQLVDGMERHPDAGLVQTVPTVSNGRTLFGRWQQFASRLYGPVSTAGLLWWSGAESSFWGHNAIIRVRAFAESCGLPHLKGRAPFGGAVMSHDMVEAALLRRRGWGVHMVSLPEGSYEEYPPTLIDFAIRDRRWCQGNLQHLKLLGSGGFHWIGRIHLLMGASAYLTSPLWALLIATGMLQHSLNDGGLGVWSPLSFMTGWPLVVTMLLLFGPKLLSLTWTLIDRRRRAEYGGTVRLLASVTIDLPLATLLAPAMMVTQTTALITLLAGKRGGWNSQRRDVDGISAAEAFSRYRTHLFIGLALVPVCIAVPGLTLWMVPIIAGLLVAPMLVMVTSRRDLGQLARRAGLFVTPEEQYPLPILREAQRATADEAPYTFDAPALSLAFDLTKMVSPHPQEMAG